MLAEIEGIVAECELEMGLQERAATQLGDSAAEITTCFDEPGKVGFRLYEAIHRLNLEAAKRTQDIELHLSRKRMSELLPFSFDKIEREAGGYKFAATHIGPAAVRWRHPGDSMPRHDALVIETKVDFEDSSAGLRRLEMRLHLLLRLGKAGDPVGVIQLGPVEFRGRDGEPVDPLSHIPLKDRARQQVRQELWKAIADRLVDQVLELPSVPITPGTNDLSPHTYTIADGILVLIDRHLSKRRSARDIAPRLFGRFSQAVRVGTAHVHSRIASDVRVGGNKVRSIKFHDRWIFLAVEREHVERACHIKIIVNAYIDYRLTIGPDRPNVLYTEVSASKAGYRIRLERCWPKCGDIMREVESQVKRELPKYYHQTFPFADLSLHAASAIARVDPDGVTIFMEPYS